MMERHHAKMITKTLFYQSLTILFTSVMKHSLLIMFVMLSLATANVYGQVYPINFDVHATNPKNIFRYLHTVSMGRNTLEVQAPPAEGDKWPVYYDKTSTVLTAQAGKRYTIKYDYPGGWMHGYAYIDYNKDGEFSYDVNDDGTPATGSEVVSFSYLWRGGDKPSCNSAGEVVTTNNTLDMPSFKIPSNVPGGDYHIRFKIDWSDLNPGGGTEIVKNGGAVVDAILRITNTTGIVDVVSDVKATNAPVYNLQGQRVTPNRPGIYIRNGKKFVVK